MTAAHRALAALAPLVLVLSPDAVEHRRLRLAFRERDLRVLSASTGAEGLVLAEGHNPDVVLLDDNLPDLSALDVMAKLRAWTFVPILVMSPSGEEARKIEALEGGANDYLTRPYGVGELLARVRVWTRHVARANAEGGDAVLEAGDIRIDLEKRLGFVGGREVHFTPLEYKLLAMLLRNAGKVLTHEQMLVTVWGPVYAQETQYLRVFVGQLRRKVETDPARPRQILTEPGVGYRLRAPD